MRGAGGSNMAPNVEANRSWGRGSWLFQVRPFRLNIQQRPDRTRAPGTRKVPILQGGSLHIRLPISTPAPEQTKAFIGSALRSFLNLLAKSAVGKVQAHPQSRGYNFLTTKVRVIGELDEDLRCYRRITNHNQRSTHRGQRHI